MSRFFVSLGFFIVSFCSCYGQNNPVQKLDGSRFVNQEGASFVTSQNWSVEEIEKKLTEVKYSQPAAPQKKKEIQVRVTNRRQLPEDLQRQLRQLEHASPSPKIGQDSDTAISTIAQSHKALLLTNHEGRVVAAKVSGGAQLSRYLFLKNRCLTAQYSQPLGDHEYGYVQVEGSTMSKVLTHNEKQVKVINLRFLE